MKKRSLLALVLTFALLLSVCTCAFGGLAVSAAAAVPTFDADSQTYVANFAETNITPAKVTYDIDNNIIDKSAATYSRITVKRTDTASVLATTPLVLLAETDSNLTHDTRGNFKNSHLVMWVQNGGYVVGLLNSDLTTSPSFPNSFLKFTSQNSTGFAGHGGVYPSGTTSRPNSVTITTKVENGKISVWITDDTTGNSKVVLDEYSSADYNITCAAAGFARAADVTNTFSYAADIWTDSSNAKNALPKYNSDNHKVLAGYSTKTTQNVAVDKTVYGKVNLSAEINTNRTGASGGGYDAFKLYLGNVTINNLSKGTVSANGDWYLYFSREYGMEMRVLKSDGTGEWYYGANYKVLNYPDNNTLNYAGPYNIVYSLDATTLKVWVNGLLRYDHNFSSWNTASGTPMSTTLNSFVTGYANSGTAVATASNYMVWTEGVSDVPKYNADEHSVITNASAYTLSNKTLDQTIYGKIDLSAAKNKVTDYDAFRVFLGDATVYLADGSVRNKGKLYLQFNRTDNIDIQVFDGTGWFYWGAQNNNALKAKYPDSGNANFTGPYTVTYAFTNTNLKVWVNDILVYDFDHAAWASSGGITVKLNSFATGYEHVNGPLTSASNYMVWSDKVPVPTVDTENQKEIYNQISTGNIANKNAQFFNYSKYVADSKVAVYTRTVVVPEWDYTDYSGVCVSLASTDYNGTTGEYYLAVSLSGGYGWHISLATKDGNRVNGTYIKNDQSYSDGTKLMPDSVEVISKVEDGKISIWIDGVLVLEEYASAKFNITGSVLGSSLIFNTANGYALTHTSVWVDNDDYGYLGDLNGDMKINVLDFVVANKLANNTEGVAAFNNNVKAFNQDGTVGPNELVKMKKYLLGVIDTLENVVNFGADQIASDNLL